MGPGMEGEIIHITLDIIAVLGSPTIGGLAHVYEGTRIAWSPLCGNRTRVESMIQD